MNRRPRHELMQAIRARIAKRAQRPREPRTRLPDKPVVPVIAAAIWRDIEIMRARNEARQ